MNPVPYLRRCGEEADIGINVLAGGALGQTVSQRAAYGAGWRPTRDPDVATRSWPRKRGWCLLCWFLNWAVQRGHCAVQFTARPTPGFDMVRAGVAFGIAGLAIVGIVRMLLGWL